MNNKNLPLLIDIIFCVILLPLMIMLLPVERWLTHNSAFVFLLVIWLYAVYFLNRKLTVPLVFSKKRYWTALLLLLLTVFFTWLVTEAGAPREFFRHRSPDGHHHFFRLSPREQGIWFLYLVVTAFSIAVGLLTELYRQMLEKKELEQEKSKAELALYKAQINPHFLFNTLNTLYSLVISRSDKAEQAFVQFTGMMKYLYSNGSADFIPLDEEAAYIRQYIDIQKLRLNEHTKVRFRSDITDGSVRIAPMLLITFVENAFKYGVSSHHDSLIDISMEQEDDMFRFHVRNNVFQEALKKKGDGIGIMNCRKRLSLIYPDAHTLKIDDSGDMFEVILTIKCHKS